MKYPYYIAPAVEEYKTLAPNSEESKKLRRLISANIGDLASLRLILGIDPPEFACFYPDMATSTPTTDDTIDSFLNKFGKNSAPLGYVAQLEEEADFPSSPVEKDMTPKSDITLRQLLYSHRYEEAIQLIEHQNLNNPKKSIYFAHQIRFIKKLSQLNKYKTNNKG